MTPAEVVLSFLNALNRRDFEGAMRFIAEDIVYHNMPLPVLKGAKRFRTFLSPWIDENDEIGIIVHNLTVFGNLVVVERTDRDRKNGEKWVETRAAGFYEVRDDKIAEWRDYYDMNTYCMQVGVPYQAIVERTGEIARL